VATFSYRARSRDGKIKTGEIEAAQKEAVISLLKDRQLIPLFVKAKGGGNDIMERLNALRGIPMKEKVIFTRQLAAIVNAGIPLLQALQLIVGQTNNASMKKVIEAVIGDIEGGLTFAEALAKHKKVFSDLFVNLVKAGEVSGTLDVSLTRMADQMESDNEVRGKVKGALVLPGLVMFVMVAVVILMSIMVVPPLKSMFVEAGKDLPLPTQILMFISDFIINRWWLGIILMVGMVVGLSKFMKTSRGKSLYDVVIMRIPVMGNLSKLVVYTRMTRVLAMLLSSGVPMLKALEIVGQLTGNHIYEESIRRAADKVEHGNPLSVALKEEKLYPSMISQMIGIGEETGGIDTMLFKVAGFYETELQNMLKNLTTLMEPLLMVIMGSMVGFLVIAILMPIYGMVDVVG
jgi:type IV pilus assembly protein PilC